MPAISVPASECSPEDIDFPAKPQLSEVMIFLDVLLRQSNPLQEEILTGEGGCVSYLSSGERLFAGGHLSEVGKEELKEIASSKLNIAQRVLKA